MTQSSIENRKSKIRLTPVQARMLETARVRGRVTVSLRDRVRRRAAQRLRSLGLLAWSEQCHGWQLTEAGHIHCSRAVAHSTGTSVERYQDKTQCMAYSDFCRAN